MMVRRSMERLGYLIDTQTALNLRGHDEETHLLMSNKDWKSLLERRPAGPTRPAFAAPAAAPVNTGPPAFAGAGYYAQQDAQSRAEMELRFQSLFPEGNQAGPSRWSDDRQSTASTPQPSAAMPPPTQQRGSSGSGEAAHGQTSSVSAAGGALLPPIPVPKNRAPASVPAPTTSRGGG
jgi:hypothetical protein